MFFEKTHIYYRFHTTIEFDNRIFPLGSFCLICHQTKTFTNDEERKLFCEYFQYIIHESGWTRYICTSCSTKYFYGKYSAFVGNVLCKEETRRRKGIYFN